MDWGAFGDWIGKIEPGSWSEWVGSILTAGSLLLGFSILRRDRVKDSRAQAMRVQGWAIDVGNPDEAADMSELAAVVRVNNNSDLPIYNVGVMIRPMFWWERRTLNRRPNTIALSVLRQIYQKANREDDALDAGQEWRNPVPMSAYELSFHVIFLMFRDAAGAFHVREIGSRSHHEFRGRLWLRRDAVLTTVKLDRVRKVHGVEDTYPPDDMRGYQVLISRNGIRDSMPESHSLKQSGEGHDK